MLPRCKQALRVPHSTPLAILPGPDEKMYAKDSPRPSSLLSRRGFLPFLQIRTISLPYFMVRHLPPSLWGLDLLVLSKQILGNDRLHPRSEMDELKSCSLSGSGSSCSTRLSTVHNSLLVWGTVLLSRMCSHSVSPNQR